MVRSDPRFDAQTPTETGFVRVDVRSFEGTGVPVPRVLVRGPAASVSTVSRENHTKATRSQSPPNHLVNWPPKDVTFKVRTNI